MRTVVGSLAAAAVAATLITYLFALVYGIAILFSTSIGLDLFQHQTYLVVGAFLYETRVPFLFNALAGYFILILVYVACFMLALSRDGGFVSGLRKIANMSVSRIVPNWFAVMPLASSSLFIVVVIITALTTNVGLPTGSLNLREPYQLLYTLSYAPIVEETAFRITTLGFLVAARASWNSYVSGASTGDSKRKRFRLIGLGFLFPDQAKSEAGLPSIRQNGWRGISASEWGFLIVTSVAFGLAHILSNSGWQGGKVITASLSGFAIGLAFLGYGAYASILLHWYFNAYSYLLLEESLGGDLIVLLIIATGILGFLTLGIAILGRKSRGQTLESSVTSASLCSAG